MLFLLLPLLLPLPLFLLLLLLLLIPLSGFACCPSSVLTFNRNSFTGTFPGGVSTLSRLRYARRSGGVFGFALIDWAPRLSPHCSLSAHLSCSCLFLLHLPDRVLKTSENVYSGSLSTNIGSLTQLT